MPVKQGWRRGGGPGVYWNIGQQRQEGESVNDTSPKMELNGFRSQFSQ